MKNKSIVKLGPPSTARALARDIRVMRDLESGKRKKLLRSWSSTNVVLIPSRFWLKALRKRFGLEAHEFAGLVGAQASDVKDWEAGKHSPDPAASRLLGLLAQKPHLVKFMRSNWPDDAETKILGRKAYA